jgi:hypothetical protein
MGVDLTPVEVMALSNVEPGLVARVAETLDPRLQKIDSCRGRS